MPNKANKDWKQKWNPTILDWLLPHDHDQGQTSQTDLELASPESRREEVTLQDQMEFNIKLKVTMRCFPENFLK